MNYHQEGDNVESREYIIVKVYKIREGMNTRRPSELDNSDNISITKSWLLGFIVKKKIKKENLKPPLHPYSGGLSII